MVGGQVQDIKIEKEDLIWSDFFDLKTIKDLKEFRESLSSHSAKDRAFSRYIDSWNILDKVTAAHAFKPTSYVSEDLSCAIFHGCPSVFMGSNSWAKAAETDATFYKKRIAQLASRICCVRKDNPNAIISVAVIPEKDYIITRMLASDSQTDVRDELMHMLRKTLAAHDIHLIFNEFLDGLSAFQTLDDYVFPDSHLPAGNYIQVLARQAVHAGVAWPDIQDKLTFRPHDEYCDLVDKLHIGATNPISIPLPVMSNPEAVLTYGSQTFEDPLGDTRQVLRQAEPIDDRAILILGDSHSSIYEKRKLTYLNSHVFRETTFHWNPCGFRTDVGHVSQSIIAMEVAQRFLFTS